MSVDADWTRAVTVIAGKDLREEFRGRDVTSAAGFFGLACLVSAGLILPAGPAARSEAAAGMLWICLQFAVLLGVGRSMAREREDHCLDGLLLTPAPRTAIFLGKLTANLLIIVAIEIVVLPVFLMLAGVHLAGAGSGLALAAVTLLATIGLVVVSTLFAVVAGGTRLGDALLPLVVLPIVVPVLVAAVESSRALLGPGTGGNELVRWWVLMSAFDVLLVVVAAAAFRFVVEE
jgi:heme exporter protein B